MIYCFVPSLHTSGGPRGGRQQNKHRISIGAQHALQCVIMVKLICQHINIFSIDELETSTCPPESVEKEAIENRRRRFQISAIDVIGCLKNNMRKRVCTFHWNYIGAHIQNPVNVCSLFNPWSILVVSQVHTANVSRIQSLTFLFHRIIVC